MSCIKQVALTPDFNVIELDRHLATGLVLCGIFESFAIYSNINSSLYRLMCCHKSFIL